ARQVANVVVDVGRIDGRRPAVLVEILKQLLPGQVAATAHDARDPGVLDRDLVEHAALAAKVKADRAAPEGDVAVLERGQAERTVGARVLLVADPDEGR